MLKNSNFDAAKEIFRNEWRHLKRDGLFEVETCVTWHLVNKLAITHIRPLGYQHPPKIKVQNETNKKTEEGSTTLQFVLTVYTEWDTVEK